MPDPACVIQGRSRSGLSLLLFTAGGEFTLFTRHTIKTLRDDVFFSPAAEKPNGTATLRFQG
jgi:hypothetical protein